MQLFKLKKLLGPETHLTFVILQPAVLLVKMMALMDRILDGTSVMASIFPRPLLGGLVVAFQLLHIHLHNLSVIHGCLLKWLKPIHIIKATSTITATNRSRIWNHFMTFNFVGRLLSQLDVIATDVVNTVKDHDFCQQEVLMITVVRIMLKKLLTIVLASKLLLWYYLELVLMPFLTLIFSAKVLV